MLLALFRTWVLMFKMFDALMSNSHLESLFFLYDIRASQF